MEKYRELCVKSETPVSLRNELLFNIASERVSGTELICFIIYNKCDERQFSKIIGAALKQLKAFKSNRIIQFFATEESFEKNTTEAKYLLNKYPMLSENISEKENNCFIVFVKL